MTIRKLSIVALLLGAVVSSAFAVTKEEMEKARAITAKIYLRWANNGSDYLDSKNPSSISDLESGLRDKEKTNIQAFKKIPVPADYASWDKAKLVEYWSVTALASPGLNTDGIRSGAKSQIKSKLSAMSVTPPVAEEPAEVRPEPKKESAAESNADIPSELTEITDVEQDAEAAVDSIAASDSIAAPAKKQGSSTWIYVVALALLVIAVVALVVYASKNMNKNDNSRSDSETQRRRDPQPRANDSQEAPRQPSPAPTYNTMTTAMTPDNYSMPAEDASAGASSATDSTDVFSGDTQRMREKFAETLADKQEEIRLLSRQVSSLTEENRSLASRIEVLRLENERLQREKDELMAGPSRPVAAAPGRISGAAPAAGRTPAAGQSRDIYLGRVNSKGLFVRADRNFNPGNSIYVLHTGDGFTGTFYIADHSSVPDLVFPRPQEMLAGGCVAMDITDTRGRSRIRTEAPGTAIFENNCWRVTRKARIRYE